MADRHWYMKINVRCLCAELSVHSAMFSNIASSFHTAHSRVNLICNFIIICSSHLFHTGSSISTLASAVTNFPHLQHQQMAAVSRCNEVSGIWAPCICSLELCVGWYPCGLKYCKGKSDNSNSINNNQINTSYRCGIKTCRKCSSFNYYVRQKQQCLWDDWPSEKSRIQTRNSIMSAARRTSRRRKRNSSSSLSSSTLQKYFQSIFNFNLL